jgi:hypothetical protein
MDFHDRWERRKHSADSVPGTSAPELINITIR